jgi:hypothetical protein
LRESAAIPLARTADFVISLTWLLEQLIKEQILASLMSVRIEGLIDGGQSEDIDLKADGSKRAGKTPYSLFFQQPFKALS